MQWIKLVVPILSILAAILGLFKVYYEVKSKKEIQKDEQKFKEKEELKRILEARPRLEIVSYLDFKSTQKADAQSKDCDVLVLAIEGFKEDNGRARFFYDEKALDDKNLVFVEYELRNIGLTEIKELSVVGNLPRDMSVMKLDGRETVINQNFLNYEAIADKRNIKQGDIIKIRVYYIEGKVLVSNIGGATLTLWLRDVNNRYWSQSLRAPMNEIELPELRNYKALIESTNIEKAIECFTKPYMR